MELPKIKMPQMGGLNGIKDKLGFGGGNDDRGDYDQYDDFDEADDAEGGYGRYDDSDMYYGDSGYSKRSNYYRDIEPINGSSTARVYPAQASTSRYSGSPNLVSFDDVRAHTAATKDYGRSADTNRRSAYDNSGAYDSGARNMGSSRSSGYDSLFGKSSARSEGAAGNRHLEIVRPFSYEEAEQIAKVLRRGEVVVLDLAATDQSLYKRILDFSFGAASMVNARVDCLASKIFSIQTGERLNSDEMNQLRNQGVL